MSKIKKMFKYGQKNSIINYHVTQLYIIQGALL